MKYSEILREIAAAHNLLLNIFVNGDNVIYMSDALRILRNLASCLGREAEPGEASGSEAKNDAEIRERSET